MAFRGFLKKTEHNSRLNVWNIKLNTDSNLQSQQKRKGPCRFKMSQIKSLIFILQSVILTYVSVTFTYGFTTKGQCAVLFDSTGLGGRNFTVGDGRHFSNLEEEYVNVDTVWNVTQSFTVSSGCVLTACNDSYFDGNCKDFQNQTLSLPSDFRSVYSAHCACAKVCQLIFQRTT